MDGCPMRVLVVGERPAVREALALLLGREADLEVVSECASAAGLRWAAPGASVDVSVVDIGPTPMACAGGIIVVRGAPRSEPVVDTAAGGVGREHGADEGAMRVIDAAGTFAEVLAAIRGVRGERRPSAAGLGGAEQERAVEQRDGGAERLAHGLGRGKRLPASEVVSSTAGRVL